MFYVKRVGTDSSHRALKGLVQTATCL